MKERSFNIKTQVIFVRDFENSHLNCSGDSVTGHKTNFLKKKNLIVIGILG